MKILTLLLTAIISGIFHKQCQWLTWRVWWHALAFVTHEITWRRAYVALLSPLPWKKWCHFASKSTESSHNSRSTLAWVMAWCLTVPSHYLNQDWLPITMDDMHSSECKLTASAQATILYNESEYYTFNFTSTFCRWATSCRRLFKGLLTINNARSTSLNPLYSIEYKLIRKIRQNETWVYATNDVTIPLNSMTSQWKYKQRECTWMGPKLYWNLRIGTRT